MERYELTQQTIRRSHVFPGYAPNGRSFISTALVNDSMSYGDDLRKSRIQNLPNYKKTNLGENVSFIVVFQTIQIQRLSNQVQLLRVKLKQAERVLFNAQNYEVQIRELTQKCFNYEKQRQEYRQEYEKLNKICQAMYHENEMLKNQLNQMDFSLKQKYQSERIKNNELLQQIEKWKSRYQAAQKSKSKQLEQLRNLMDSQRKSMIDREIRQMTIRFQNQRSSLESQIRKCREMLNNRNAEIEDYKQRCQKYEIMIMELRNYEHVISQNENKLVLLSNELLRLNQILRARDDDIQNFKKREYDLNLKLKEQSSWENQNKNMKNMLESRNKEIEEWKIRSSRLQEEAIRGKEMLHYNHQLNDKLELATREIDRLNSVLKGKIDQLQKLKNKYNSKQAQLSQYKNLQNEVAQYQSKISMIKAENDRINGILKSRLEEIENGKRRNAELQSAITRYGLLEKDKKNLQDKFNAQIKNNQELKFALNRLENDNSALRKYELKCNELGSKNDNLGREIDRLNSIIKNNSQEINDYRIKYTKIESSLNDYRNIQMQMKDYQNKIVLLTQQIQRLNTLIRNKNDDIEQLERDKLQMHSQISLYKNYEIKINENEQTVAKLQNNIEICKKDIQNWQNKFRTSDARVKQLENNVFAQSQQKQKISSIAKSKAQQYDDLRNRYNRLENEMNKLGDLQIVCQQQHNQILIYLADIEALERKSMENEAAYNRERNGTAQLKSKIALLSSQLQRVTRELTNTSGKNSREYQQLQQTFSRLQMKVKSKDNQIQVLLTKINSLESQCSNLLREFQRLLEIVERSSRQTEALSLKIDQYQDYARRIHILGAELDRLGGLNKGLQADIKAMRLKYADNMNAEKKEQDYYLATVLMAVEIQSLRSRIEQREVSLDQMRKSILDPVRRI